MRLYYKSLIHYHLYSHLTAGIFLTLNITIFCKFREQLGSHSYNLQILMDCECHCQPMQDQNT